MKKLNKKGFTLIELIVVIAILAILAAILIPAITGYITKAEQGRDSANCRSSYSQAAMSVMLEADPLVPASGAVVSGLTITYTVDTTNNVINAGFKCVGATGTYTAPDFKRTATPAP